MRTYFENMITNTGTVHRVETGTRKTACGMPLPGGKQIALDVTCNLCKITKAYKHGGH